MRAGVRRCRGPDFQRASPPCGEEGSRASQLPGGPGSRSSRSCRAGSRSAALIEVNFIGITYRGEQVDISIAGTAPVRHSDCDSYSDSHGKMNENRPASSQLPGMQLRAAVVVLAASLPDPEVRHPVNSLYTEHQVLDKRDLEGRKGNVNTRAAAGAQAPAGTVTPVGTQPSGTRPIAVSTDLSLQREPTLLHPEKELTPVSPATLLGEGVRASRERRQTKSTVSQRITFGITNAHMRC